VPAYTGDCRQIQGRGPAEQAFLGLEIKNFAFVERDVPRAILPWRRSPIKLAARDVGGEGARPKIPEISLFVIRLEKRGAPYLQITQ
jgi:hypothetical protein